MNDPKILQLIAEKACQFDRMHFADGCDPEPDTMLRHHEKLETDPKLITRLHVRYAVTLGFLEGYVLAIEDGNELRRERDELQTKLAEAERTGADHAAQLEDEIRTLVAERDRYKREMTESKSVVKLIGYWRDVAQSNTIGEGFRDGLKSCVKDLERAIEEDESKNDPKNIGIVIKPPPPPPPPAAPPPPNELRTEIDDELAQAAANHANKVHGYGSVHDDSKQAREALTYDNPAGWAIPVQSFVYGAQWQLSRIENAHAGDDPTMHFPPAFDRAPMPSDREIAELVCRMIYTWTDDDIEHVVNVLNCEREDLRRKIGMYSGSTAEACAIKFALLHFRDRIVGSANQAPMPSVATSNVVRRAMAVADLLRKQGMHVAAVNRIVDGKSRSAIAFGHEQTTLVFVDRPRHDRMQTEDVADEVVDSYELSKQHIVDSSEETVVEVTDELLLEAAKFANESERFTSPADKLPPDRELECAKRAMREDCVMT